jgi:cyclophilin family peptidyl-prolyl cis-trans isomerase
MKFWKKGVLAAILILAGAAASAEPVQVLVNTSKGAITLELDADRAPKTVANFLAYVDDGFYDGTIFHRVIKDFMIQGGGFTAEMTRKETRDPVPNEADNGLKNLRGTIAMARTSDPNSATAQFFINHKDNAFLDHRSMDARGWGYAVFGKVVEGMDVVDAIAGVPTTTRNGMKDVPAEPVTIASVTRVTPAQ